MCIRDRYTDDTPDWLGEFDYTSTSGWMITVNDYFIDKSAGAWEVKDGDVIRWQFTVYGLGADIGNSSPDASYGGQQSLIDLPNKDLLTRLIAEKGAANVPAAVMEIATKLNATADEVSKAVAALQGDSSALEELNQVVSTSGNTTTVQVSGSVSGTTVKAELSKDHGAEMVKQAKDGKVSNVEIKVTTKDNTSSATAVEVVIPTSAVQSLAKDTAANLKVDSSQGSLILDEKALDEVASKAKGDTVTLRLEQIAKATDTQLSAVGEGGLLLQASAKSGDMTLGSLGVRFPCHQCITVAGLHHLIQRIIIQICLKHFQNLFKGQHFPHLPFNCKSVP